MDSDPLFLPSGTTPELFPTYPHGIDIVVPGKRRPVRFRFLLDGVGREKNRITLCIEITDDTTQEDIKAAWPAVLRWRELIQRNEGHYAWTGQTGALFGLWRDHEEGMSYRDLADRVNDRIAKDLASDPINGRFHADYSLLIYRPSLSPEERAEIIDAALAEVKSGRKPFIGPEEPVTSGDIRERIREFRRTWGDRLEGWEKIA